MCPASPHAPVTTGARVPQQPPRPSEERSTHRELVIRPQHVLLLLARRVPADVGHHEERGGQADGRTRQDTAPKGSVEHLFADHQGQSQEQSVCPVGERGQNLRAPSSRVYERFTPRLVLPWP